MVTVLRVHLPSDIPIVGCELTPYVLLKRADKSHISDDITEFNPIDGHFLRYKWSVKHSYMNLLMICICYVIYIQIELI